jgi:hypothetical protein
MRNLSNAHQLIRRLSPFALAGALSVGVLGTSHDAQAQVVVQEVEVVQAPPVARVEVIPVAPSVRHFWQHGYWGWNGAAHYWVPGRYEVIRPGWGWAEPRWVGVGPRYHFYPGYWYQYRY